LTLYTLMLYCLYIDDICVIVKGVVENNMVELMTRRINVIWADRDDEAIKIIHEELKKQGLFFERDGKPKVSAIIDYVLVQKVREIEKGKQDA
jgi:hypothetical protein